MVRVPESALTKICMSERDAKKGVDRSYFSSRSKIFVDLPPTADDLSSDVLQNDPHLCVDSNTKWFIVCKRSGRVCPERGNDRPGALQGLNFNALLF